MAPVTDLDGSEVVVGGGGGAGPLTDGIAHTSSGHIAGCCVIIVNKGEAHSYFLSMSSIFPIERLGYINSENISEFFARARIVSSVSRSVV